MRKFVLMLALSVALTPSCNNEDKFKLEQLQQELDEPQQSIPAVPGATDVTVPEDGAYSFKLDRLRYGVDAGNSVAIAYTIHWKNLQQLNSRPRTAGVPPLILLQTRRAK